MKTIFASVRFALVLVFAFGCNQAWAFDLDGAWATNVSVCDKIFGKDNKGALYIKPDADSYGSGFIVRQNSVVGKIATCKIKTRKTIGSVTHVIASCSTDVALQTVQFSFRVKDDNHIIRIYPGLEELDIAYGRCPP